MRKKGLFISFEGMDCSGKTTQAKLLEGNLTAKEYKVLYLREPGGTRIGEKVREILLSPTENICERAELLLFLASRAQMTEEIIIPELKKKKLLELFEDVEMN